MAALTGTNVFTTKPKWQAGMQYTAVGYYDLAGAITNADTITWTDILPATDNKITLLDFRVWGQELDTNASPSLAIVIGDGTDTDAYLKSKTAGDANGQMQFFGDGDSVGTVITTSNDVVLTTSGTLGTAASSGRVWIAATYYCSN